MNSYLLAVCVVATLVVAGVEAEKFKCGLFGQCEKETQCCKPRALSGNCLPLGMEGDECDTRSSCEECVPGLTCVNNKCESLSSTDSSSSSSVAPTTPEPPMTMP